MAYSYLNPTNNNKCKSILVLKNQARFFAHLSFRLAVSMEITAQVLESTKSVRLALVYLKGKLNFIYD